LESTFSEISASLILLQAIDAPPDKSDELK
jgi:hypothetical protein